MPDGRPREHFAATFAALVLILCARMAPAQELEPRSLTNVPIGMNFLVAGYAYSTGNILLDPAVPIEDLDSKLHTIVGGYVRSIDFFGRSGKVDVIVPFAAGDWEAKVSGRDSTRVIDGFGDLSAQLSVNFVGAPALRAAEYGGYREHTIVGASLRVVVPTGQYDPSKLINLSSNRWAFRSRVGASHVIRDWIVETYASLWLFTKNSDFYGGNEVKQDPLGALVVHAIYTWPKRKSWIALDAGYAIGGRTEINGVKKDTRISTFRFGATLVVPLGTRNTVRLTGITGVRHERGPDFDAIALTYQFRWGGM